MYTTVPSSENTKDIYVSGFYKVKVMSLEYSISFLLFSGDSAVRNETFLTV